jgi:hypothetical protein
MDLNFLLLPLICVICHFFLEGFVFDYESQIVCVLGGMRVLVIMNLANLGPN